MSDGLSHKQKELLEQVAKLYGYGTFDERHQQLQFEGLLLSADQLREMRSAFFGRTEAQQKHDFAQLNELLRADNDFDGDRLSEMADAVFARSIAEERSEFEFLDQQLAASGHLSPQQIRQLHAALAGVSHEEQKRRFQEIDRSLKTDGVAIPEAMLVDLGNFLFARSRDEHVKEFALKDSRLVMPQKEELYAFVEPPAVQPQAVPADFDSIPTPVILEQDRVALDAIPEPKLPPKREAKPAGLLSRLKERVEFTISQQKDPWADHKKVNLFSVENVFGFAMLAIPIVAFFTLPAMFQAHMQHKTTQQLQAEQAALDALDEKADDAEITRLADLVALQFDSTTGVAPPPNIIAPNTSNASPADLMTQLAAARREAKDGDLKGAAACYQGFVRECPQFIPARIELIKVLLAAKSRKRAQEECIATLKQKLSDAEHEAVWALMKMAFGL